MMALDPININVKEKTSQEFLGLSKVSQPLQDCLLQVFSKCICYCHCLCLRRCLKDCSFRVFSKCVCHCLCLCHCRCPFWPDGQCFFITLSKCFKGHKSQRLFFQGVLLMYLSLSLSLYLYLSLYLLKKCERVAVKGCIDQFHAIRLRKCQFTNQKYDLEKYSWCKSRNPSLREASRKVANPRVDLLSAIVKIFVNEIQFSG